MTEAKGEIMRKCQDALSAASERNPVQVMIASIDDKGQLQIARCSDLAGGSWMIQSLTASMNDAILKEMKI